MEKRDREGIIDIRITGKGTHMLFDSRNDTLLGGVKLQICNFFVFVGAALLKYEILESYLTYTILIVALLGIMSILSNHMREYYISWKIISFPARVIVIYLIIELFFCFFGNEKYFFVYPSGLVVVYIILIIPWQQKKLKTLKKALYEIAPRLEGKSNAFTEDTFDALEQITIPNRKTMGEIGKLLETIPEECITSELQEAVKNFFGCIFTQLLLLEGLVMGLMMSLVILVL